MAFCSNEWVGRKGIYWFNGGLNWRAFLSWAVATGVGLLFASTSIVTGPLTDQVSGIDLSFISAAVVGGVLYFVLVKIFPETGADPGKSPAQPVDVAQTPPTAAPAS